MRVVCDANILVRAAVRPQGPARAVLDAASAPPHVLVVSEAILAEVRRALGYERLQRLVRMNTAEIDAYVAAVEGVADLISLPGAVPAVCRDPDDDAILATAVLGRADVLCTLDRALRSPDVAAYCAMHGVRVLTDVELLAQWRAAESVEGDEGS